jgi:hypothetical protein
MRWRIEHGDSAGRRWLDRGSGERDANDGNGCGECDGDFYGNGCERQREQRRDVVAFLRDGKCVRLALGNNERIGDGGDLHRAGDCSESSDDNDCGHIRDRWNKIRVGNDHD